MTPKQVAYIKAVREFALKFYEQHCSHILECMSDEDIVRDYFDDTHSLYDILVNVIEDAEMQCEQVFETAFDYESVKDTPKAPTNADVVEFVEAWYSIQAS